MGDKLHCAVKTRGCQCYLTPLYHYNSIFERYGGQAINRILTPNP